MNYLIIKQDEMPNSLIYLSDCMDDTKRKLDKIASDIRHYNELRKTDKWDELVENKTIDMKNWMLSLDSIENYCVQKWDGSKFFCVCDKFNFK